jgi:hypothetical protein
VKLKIEFICLEGILNRILWIYVQPSLKMKAPIGQWVIMIALWTLQYLWCFLNC